MLRALGEQLKLLAADPKNNFSSAIRQLAGPREAARYGQPLRRMILAMPEMIAQLRAWSGGSGLPTHAKRMQEFALTYLYEPVDFLPAKSPGLFRYMDDAYLIARIYQLTLIEHDASGVKNWSDNRALANSVPEWIDLTRRFLPKETSKIDSLLEEAAKNHRRRLSTIRSRAAKTRRNGSLKQSKKPAA